MLRDGECSVRQVKKIVILGAGLTGLSAAHFLEKRKIKPLILEKENEAGGLCRTEEKNGFFFDYTGHLLHFKNKKWLRFITTELKVPLKKRSRSASIQLLGRSVPYPFQYHLAYLPQKEKNECVKDFLACGGQTERLSPSFDFAQDGEHVESFDKGGLSGSFYTWARDSFGERMFRLFFHPYNKKLWGCDLRKMSTLWMGRFVPPPSKELILKGAERRNPGQSAGYNASFYYPERGGIGEIVKPLAKGKNIILGTEVKSIDPDKKIIFTGKGKISYDGIISAIPLPVLINRLRGSPGMRKLSRKLKWVSVKNTNLVFKKNFSEMGHWIYFPEKKFPFYRIGFLSNFSGVRGGFSNIYVETSYGNSSSPFSKGGCIQAKFGSCSVKSVLKFLRLTEKSVLVRKDLNIPYAYVIYDNEREKVLPEIFGFLKKHGIISTGRFGGWKYSTMEESLEDGLAASHKHFTE